MVIWLPVARLGVSNTRFQFSVKAVGATINLNSDKDNAVRDTLGDIAEVDIILD